jgi:hypothetical protein
LQWDKKGKKSMQIGKEEIKLFLFAGNIIVYTKKFQEMHTNQTKQKS